MNKDIAISVSDVTVTSVVISIDSNVTPLVGSTYAAFYSTLSYDDEERDQYAYYGGSSIVGGATVYVPGLIPDTDYFIRVFEIPSGDTPNPNIGYDYSIEESFTTNATLAAPRIYDHFCSETPITLDLRGGPVTESSTSVRIGAGHIESGAGSVFTQIEFSWRIDGSKITYYQSLTDIQNYYDFVVNDLPVGAMIIYRIQTTNDSGQVARADGYTYVFPDDDGEYRKPAELQVEEIWKSMRPGNLQERSDGPLLYFSGAVRNSNYAGIAKAIVKYGDAAEYPNRLYYSITEDGSGSMAAGTFVIDSEQAPIVSSSFINTMDVRFMAPIYQWKYNSIYDDSDAPYIYGTVEVDPPWHKAVHTSIASSVVNWAKTKLKFNGGFNENVLVLANSAYSYFEPECIVFKFILPDDYNYDLGLIRAFIKLHGREARIDKTLTSTAFAMACDENGDIILTDSEPAAFSSTDIAFINNAAHCIPVEPIIQYYLESDSQDIIYIRVQLGSTYDQSEHSGSAISMDTGFISAWSAYGKEDALDSSDIEKYIPSLEIYQTDELLFTEPDGIPTVEVTDIDSSRFSTQIYEYMRWNGGIPVEDTHELVSAYANTIDWTQHGAFRLSAQPPEYNIYKPVFFILRYGGFWAHALQPGLEINGMNNLTENLGINELTPGMIYGGSHPLSFLVAGAVVDTTAPVIGSTYQFIDYNSGQFGDFDEEGERLMAKVGVSAGIDPGDTMHYYYMILQTTLWGSGTSDWGQRFVQVFGSNIADDPVSEVDGILTFTGDQINQAAVRYLIADREL